MLWVCEAGLCGSCSGGYKCGTLSATLVLDSKMERSRPHSARHVVTADGHCVCGGARPRLIPELLVSPVTDMMTGNVTNIMETMLSDLHLLFRDKRCRRVPQRSQGAMSVVLEGLMPCGVDQRCICPCGGA
jgi:hypothetical protein